MLNNRSKIVPAFAAALLLAFATLIPTSAKTLSSDHHAAPAKDIVDTAVAAESFKTLAQALVAADLVNALKGDGPFTVFAPTDEAFAKLPAGAVEMLLKPENKDKLRAVLLYHVVPGKVIASDVVKLNGKMAKTLEGSSVKINTRQGVVIDKSRVVKADVMASNGVIHVIDTVLMPKTK